MWSQCRGTWGVSWGLGPLLLRLRSLSMGCDQHVKLEEGVSERCIPSTVSAALGNSLHSHTPVLDPGRFQKWGPSSGGLYGAWATSLHPTLPQIPFRESAGFPGSGVQAGPTRQQRAGWRLPCARISQRRPDVSPADGMVISVRNQRVASYLRLRQQTDLTISRKRCP